MENNTANNNGRVFAIIALVLGIIACVIPWWGVAGGIIAILCAIGALVLAVMAKKTEDSGISTAALILALIGIVLAIIGLIACGICSCCASIATREGGISLLF